MPTCGTSANSLNQYTAISSQPSAFSYDEDGNMTQYVRPSDGKIMNLTWGAENRLLSIEPAIPQSGDKKVENVYDGQSRRVRKTVSTYNGSWSVTKDEKFLYDGWNLAAAYNPGNNALLRTCTFGLDLSGSLQGAGGVGGLLAIDDGAAHAYTFDANGNVSEVLDNSGSVVAHYEYDPFGNTMTVSGGYAAVNVYRFSTKYQDDESGFYYYGHRFYSPELGRWPSRDPIEEQGGENLYGFVANNPVNLIDLLGELGYSSLGWYSILNCPSIKDYEKDVLEAKAKKIAKNCKTTSETLPGLSEFHESTFNIMNGVGTALATTPGALEVGQIYAKIGQHDITVKCEAASCTAKAKLPVSAWDVFAFPADGHNDILHYMGFGLIPPIPRSGSKDKDWSYKFSL